jgi:exonuclease VII large subunit
MNEDELLAQLSKLNEEIAKTKSTILSSSTDNKALPVIDHHPITVANKKNIPQQIQQQQKRQSTSKRKRDHIDTTEENAKKKTTIRAEPTYNTESIQSQRQQYLQDYETMQQLNRTRKQQQQQQQQQHQSQASNESFPTGDKQLKKKRILRSAAGEVWEDPTLLEWPENDYRIFVGNLGNDVTDEVLNKTFSVFPSFAKAKVIRDKKTLKSKGFGFVSFTDVNDYITALDKMDGKYIGNRPCKLKKSNWKDRSLT